MQAFEETYKREFGFVLEQRSIIVDDLRVRATGKVHPTPGLHNHQNQSTFTIKKILKISAVISMCSFSCVLERVSIFWAS